MGLVYQVYMKSPLSRPKIVYLKDSEVDKILNKQVRKKIKINMYNRIIIN
jgi:hypothetical protein